MTKTLRNRLVLLGTTSFFALALAAAPVQFSSITPDLAVAHAQGVTDGAGGGGGDGGVSGGGHTAGGGQTSGDGGSPGGGTSVDGDPR